MSAPTDGYRLSARQRQLWRARRRDVPMQTVLLVEVAGPVDEAALRRAVEDLARRHEMMRTSFRTVSGMRVPLQVVAEDPVVRWRVHEPVADPTEVIDGLWADALRRAYAVDEEPVVATLVPDPSGGAHLLLGMSALAVDARGLITVLDDLRRAYAGEVATDEVPSYAQYAQWQQDLQTNHADRQAAAHWQKAGAAATSRPALPLERRATDRAPGSLTREFPAGLDNLVAAVANDRTTTADLVVLAAWAALLSRLTGAGRITIGQTVDGRGHDELRASVGPYDRPAPTTVVIGADTRFDDVLAQLTHAGREHARSIDMWGDPGAQGDLALGFVPVPAPAGPGTPIALRRLHVGGLAHEVTLLHHQHGPGRCELRFPPTLDAEAAAILLDQLVEVLAAACRDPQLRLSTLAVVTERELRLINQFNDTDVPEAGEVPLPRLVAEQAARTPDALAVACGDERLTYAELDRRTDQLARTLRDRGIGRGSVCGVWLEPGVAVPEALLGVLKSGAAYLPIDPAWPVERVSSLLRDAAVDLVLSHDGPRHADVDVPVLLLDGEADTPAQVPTDPVDVEVTTEDLAAIIYTSGSTGTPKGVCVTHRGLSNYLTWCRGAYPVTEGRGSLVHSSIGYDLTVTALFAPLLVGQCVRFAAPAGLEGLVRAFDEQADLGLLKVTPTHLRLLHRMLPGERRDRLARSLVVGGESLTEQTVAPWRAALPRVRVFNEYGPTETVVGCCVHDASEAGRDGAVPIGRPIANTRLYVLDPAMRPVPLGLPGELYVGGAGVARGYHGRPGPTAERFVPDAFSGRPGERLYRTGDLVRHLPDGALEFLGRVDDQQQVNGFRVEPGEIETTLTSHPAVREAAVAVQREQDGNGRIVACVVPAPQAAPDAEELRRFLRERLPEHMVPATVASVAVLPVTPAGKVDRRAVVERAAKERRGGRAAGGRTRTDAEKIVTRIWEQALGYEGIGLEESFFDLGGNSFLLLDVAGQLQSEFGVEVTPLMLLEHPTIASTAAALTQHAAATRTDSADPPEAAPVDDGGHARRQREAMDQVRLRRAERPQQ